MNKKMIVSVLVFMIFLMVPVSFVYAGEDAVTIRILENKYMGNGRYELRVQCHVGKEQLSNEQLKLSYHVWNEDRTELIAYENKRISISDRYEPDVTVKLEIALTEPKKDAWICLDIVDEKNGFWFAGTDGIEFQSEDIYYSYSFLKNLKTIWKINLEDHTILFGVNVAIGIIFIYACRYVKKKEIL
ncbi:hypothetical protein C823_003317 [Eubacterium plexicaudatum ASF492]|uniref:Uncharacterized protein n=1 Tax=Eubacterium plexicaudatum ASF492 TaxID=1235802 RepID=N2ANX8_9FIRM|nr:hypothetical protein C823_003317 [Eubacterium plexicaudatum ASF492]